MTRLLIHGGASNLDALSQAAKQEAVDAVSRTVQRGSSALDIVTECVSLLEDQAQLNAGTGSVMQLDGVVRMDAGICDSAGRYAGVLQIEQVANPIRVARRLLDLGYHSLLSGAGAERFAREQGFGKHDPCTRAAWMEYIQSRKQFRDLDYGELAQGKARLDAQKLGTVGAVALDAQGNLAAACSTGGTKFCYPGRVGDTGIFGAGVYCSENVAVACTGEGDKVLRCLTARRVEDFLLDGGDLQKAVDRALAELKERQRGMGGIIAVARDGRTAWGHNTAFMAMASLRDD